MWEKKSVRFFLAVSLMLCVSVSSLSALSFLPSYSGDSEETGLMSILRSMGSGKHESTSEEQETSSTGDVKCFTEEEIAEIDGALAAADAELAKAEEELKKADPFFGVWFGPYVGSFGYLDRLTYVPGIRTDLQFGKVKLNLGVGYEIPAYGDLPILTWDTNKIHAEVGVMLKVF